jgi:hypothetical protein
VVARGVEAEELLPLLVAMTQSAKAATAIYPYETFRTGVVRWRATSGYNSSLLTVEVISRIYFHS